jgi:hypothetical protein
MNELGTRWFFFYFLLDMAHGRSYTVFEKRYLASLQKGEEQRALPDGHEAGFVRAHHVLAEAGAGLEDAGADGAGEGQPRDVHGLHMLLRHTATIITHTTTTTSKYAVFRIRIRIQ